MRYWQSYRFVFNNPNWLTNLALTAVCLVIPMIGQIVVIGYCFDILDDLMRRRGRRGASRFGDDANKDQILDALPVQEDHDRGGYPDFNFNRFADYLTRGIWPFLVRMIVNLVIGMVAGFFLMVGMMLAGVAAASAKSPALIFVVYAVVMVIYAILMAVVGMLTTPLYLRAGLSSDFATAFSMDFYRDFMRRVGKEVVLAELFLFATGGIVSFVGLLMCYVGLFPAMALLLYVHHHLEYQLYELYLERGGMPVKHKDKIPALVEDYRDDEFSSPEVIRPEERSTDIRRSRDDNFAD